MGFLSTFKHFRLSVLKDSIWRPTVENICIAECHCWNMVAEVTLSLNVSVPADAFMHIT